jgi:hypothetical protein
MTNKRHCRRGFWALLVAPLAAAAFTTPAQAASSEACEDGAFRLVNLANGRTVGDARTGEFRRTVSIADLGAQFAVRGRYVQFTVRSADFAVLDYAFTGAANPQDITGGRFTPVFAGKVPDHRGLTLTSGVEARLRDEDLVLRRGGSSLDMKIQAKDCAQGGIFQMEPERDDGTRTRIVHTLATPAEPALTPFYFDNPRFRERAGEFLGSGCTSTVTGPPGQFCVQVTPRVNIANDASPAFVARDSAQLAVRVPQADCDTVPAVGARHCGGVSIWDVASGGRMGFVSGEDATEVANPPTACDADCQAQNQVNGRLAVLGHPFPVAATSRLTPRFSSTAPGPLTR